MLFLDIFLSSILPLFILIGIGMLVDKLFHLDIPTLSKLNFYVFSPVLLFSLISESTLDSATILKIGGFWFISGGAILIIAIAAFSGTWTGHRRPIMTLGSIFSNNAIFGLSVILLAFGEQAASVLAVHIILQTGMVYTFGIMVVQGAGTNLRESLKTLIRYPMVYAILLGLLFQHFSIVLPDPLQFPLDQIRGSFLAVALFTLGAQLARSEIFGEFGLVAVGIAARLIIAPLITFGILATGLFTFDPLVRDVLLLTSGFPVAVNVYVLAVEFERAPGYASRIVFWSTLLSAITVTILLIIIRQMGG